MIASGLFITRYTSRGDDSSYERLTHGDMDWYKAQGLRLVRRYVNLRPWRTTATLPVALLNNLRADLDVSRASGVPLIIRCVYDTDGAEPADATLTRTLGHIEQLAPVFSEYLDAIAYVEAGFIGKWGEWHSSANFSNEWNYSSSWADRRAVVEAILSQWNIDWCLIRTPRYLMRWDELGNIAASHRARIGGYNDSFLYDTADRGTFHPDFMEAERNFWKAEAQLGKPLGGEHSDDTGGQNEYASANFQQFYDYRLHYLNGVWPEAVLNMWKSTGRWEEIGELLIAHGAGEPPPEPEPEPPPGPEPEPEPLPDDDGRVAAVEARVTALEQEFGAHRHGPPL